MKLFFSRIKDSIYNKSFYRGLVSEASGRSAFRYVLGLSILVAVVSTLFASFVLYPMAYSGVAFVYEYISKDYPADLSISIKNGVASTSVNRVYTWHIPESQKLALAKSSNGGVLYSKVIVIDASSTASDATYFKTLDTMAFLSHTDFMYYDNNSIRIMPLRSIPDVTIDKAMLLGLITNYAPLLKFILPIISVVMVAFIFIFGALMYFLEALLLGLFVWIFFRVRKAGLTYGRSYVIALFLMTLPTIVSALLTFAGINYGILGTMLIYIFALLINLGDFPVADKTPVISMPTSENK